jgi:polo-like kinase 1
MLLTTANQVLVFERRTADRVEEVSTYTLSQHPPVIAKKVLLMKHFKDYLDGRPDPSLDEFEESIDQTPLVESDQIVYVKKWLRTKHAIVFRLNVKAIQAIFLDSTELLLNVESRTVVYISRVKQRETLTIDEALQSQN